MARTITIGKGTPEERTITATGERDPRGFEKFRGPGGEILTQQGDQFIVGRARQIGATPQQATPAQGADPIANIHADPASTVGQKFAANIFTLLNRLKENQAQFRTDVREREAGLRGKEADIISEETPEDLRDFSPAQQRAIRTAGVGAEIGPEAASLQRQSALSEELFIAGAQVLAQAQQLGETMFPDVIDPKSIKSFVSLVENGQLSVNQIPAEFLPDVMAQLDPSKIDISEADKLDLEKTRAQIQLLKAQTGKARRGPIGDTATIKREQLTQLADIILGQQRAESEDGFTNPNDYRELQNAFIDTLGSGGKTLFRQRFPIEQFIAPANRVGDLRATADPAGKTVIREQSFVDIVDTIEANIEKDPVRLFAELQRKFGVELTDSEIKSSMKAAGMDISGLSFPFQLIQ